MDWIGLIQDSDNWQTLGNMVMIQCVKCLDWLGTVNLHEDFTAWLVGRSVNAVSFRLKHGIWIHSTRNFKISNSWTVNNECSEDHISCIVFVIW